MKGLLQSKKFKRNLTKWLTIYVGVIMLLSVVITYSRYISSIGGSDTARVAKFNVKLNYNNENCDLAKNSICDLGEKRPSGEITYKFSLDTNDIEVKTDLFLTLYVQKDYELISLVEDSNSDNIILQDKNLNIPSKDAVENEKDCQAKDTCKTIYKYRSFDVPFDIAKTEKDRKFNYTITLKYINDDEYATVDDEVHNAIMIGYSATQVTK